MATCSPSTLMANAQCFSGLTDGQMDMVIIQLLCEIFTSGGGGGGGGSVTCGAGAPVAAPSGSCAIYIDTNTGTIYTFYLGAWH